ncbi:MAG: hypothetical protein FVQ85_04275 [Planctomycetes bacterium]|nr:hypothetical protein [Planctomycetota bacterium]
MEKKVIVVLLVFAFCSLPSFGLSLMGPPKAGLAEGQSSIGVDYSYSETKLKFSGFGITAIEEVETNMLFINLGYGITEQCEGFVRLGVADVKLEDFDGDSEFAYGFGTKVTFIDDENVSWGGLFQINWFQGDDNFSGVNVEIDAYEIQIAAGPTYEAENMRIYGGPFLHFVDGDGDADFFGYPLGSFDVEEESVFGGYIGAGFDIADDSYLNVEFQFTGDAWAVGVGLGKKF